MAFILLLPLLSAKSKKIMGRLFLRKERNPKKVGQKGKSRR